MHTCLPRAESLAESGAANDDGAGAGGPKEIVAADTGHALPGAAPDSGWPAAQLQPAVSQ